MSPRLQFLALLLVCAASALTSCKSRFKANFVAEVSLNPDPGADHPSEETLAEELRSRIEILQVKAEVHTGESDDGRLTIRLRSAGKDEALDHLDALCHSGDLSVRAVHDQSVYLASAARRDRSKLPPGHEILTFSLRAGDQSRVEDLVVETAEIITGADVQSAEPENSKDGAVHISLSASGGQKLAKATKTMQKGRSRLAIIYDGLIISAPVVAEVLSAEFTLEGFNSFEEAQAVAAALHKPLSTNLLIESLNPLPLAR